MPARTAVNAPPVVLITVIWEQAAALAGALSRTGYTVVRAQTGAQAIERARDSWPDVVILAAELPDMSGLDACWLLRSDQRVGRNVPVLILADEKPSPEQRVAALRAGAWDFLLHPSDPDELSLKLETCIQAKRNIDDALAGGLVDPETGLHSRPGLARRARELGALMSRHRGSLACLLFALESAAADPRAGSLVAHAARVSDVVGALGPTEIAVLAPGADHTGAVKLAQRVAAVLREAIGGGVLLARGSTLRVGYDAVSNFKYSPIDAVELLARATTAVKQGKPEPSCPWVRRFEAAQPAEPSGPGSRISSPGLVLAHGRTSP